MTMQRRHFELIAATIKEAREIETLDGRAVDVDAIAKLFARNLKATNANFDPARFLRACGVPNT